MEKLNSTFLFKNEYYDSEGSKGEVTVELHISYRLKTFSILPYLANPNEGFKFIDDRSNRWPMWKATLKSINEAIDFANDELGLKQI